MSAAGGERGRAAGGAAAALLVLGALLGVTLTPRAVPHLDRFAVEIPSKANSQDFDSDDAKEDGKDGALTRGGGGGGGV